MNGELLVAIVGIFIAPIYGILYWGAIRIEHRLTKLEEKIK